MDGWPQSVVRSADSLAERQDLILSHPGNCSPFGSSVQVLKFIKEGRQRVPWVQSMGRHRPSPHYYLDRLCPGRRYPLYTAQEKGQLVLYPVRPPLWPGKRY